MEHHTATDTLLTVKQFVEKHPFVTEAALRDWIFKSQPRVINGRQLPANGLAPAIHRFGRRVYIDGAHLVALIMVLSQAPAASQVTGAGQ